MRIAKKLDRAISTSILTVCVVTGFIAFSKGEMAVVFGSLVISSIILYLEADVKS